MKKLLPKKKQKSPNGKDGLAYQQLASKAQRVEDLQKNEGIRKAIVGSFDYIMTDYEGILSRSDIPIPGAANAIMILKKMGKTFIFVTNDSKANDDEYIEMFKKMGITDVKNTDIMHPLKSITTYLQKFFVGQAIFSLMEADMNRTFVKSAFKLTSMDPLTNVKSENMKYLYPEDKVRAVVFDTNLNITYAQLAKAQQYLMDDGCAFIVGAASTFLTIKEGLTTIGPAGFISMLRETAHQEPIMLGKPGRLLGDDLIRRYNIADPSRVLFVGCHLIDDIGFGISCKFQTLFVSGSSAMSEHISKLSDDLKPHFIAKDIVEFVEYLKG